MDARGALFRGCGLPEAQLHEAVPFLCLLRLWNHHGAIGVSGGAGLSPPGGFWCRRESLDPAASPIASLGQCEQIRYSLGCLYSEDLIKGSHSEGLIG